MDIKIIVFVGIIAYVSVFILGILYRKFFPQYDITFIAAEIGAGKSCYSAKISKQFRKKKWKVYSNDYIKGNYILNIDDLLEGKIYPEKSLLIFDETGIYFNSRKFKSMPIEIISYIKKSRHYKNKIVFLSQTFSDTDKQIRDLAHRIMFIRKLIPGVYSMTVKVPGKIGIDDEGQPKIKYKIKAIGIPYFMPAYFKMFNSFGHEEKEIAESVNW